MGSSRAPITAWSSRGVSVGTDSSTGCATATRQVGMHPPHSRWRQLARRFSMRGQRRRRGHRGAPHLRRKRRLGRSGTDSRRSTVRDDPSRPRPGIRERPTPYVRHPRHRKRSREGAGCRCWEERAPNGGKHRSAVHPGWPARRTHHQPSACRARRRGPPPRCSRSGQRRARPGPGYRCARRHAPHVPSREIASAVCWARRAQSRLLAGHSRVLDIHERCRLNAARPLLLLSDHPSSSPIALPRRAREAARPDPESRFGRAGGRDRGEPVVRRRQAARSRRPHCAHSREASGAAKPIAGSDVRRP
jgi:hypothetical protein